MTRVKFSAILVIVCFTIFSTKTTKAQDVSEPNVEIFFPLPGAAVQGLVQITGTIEVNDLNFFVFEFTFQESSGQDWFEINKGEAPTQAGILAEWDTSSIPDGYYNLRLTVNRSTTDPIILIIEGVRVRNYSQIETDTPAPTDRLPIFTPTNSEQTPNTPTVELLLTPTPYNPNPAEVTMDEIQKKIIQGAIGGIVIFIIFLIYRSSRSKNL